MAAARRKGKWLGGRPVLGYDVDPDTKKLIVQPEEASQVQAIFDLYLQHGSLIPVVNELRLRNWRNKRWVTRKGREQGGLLFTKTSLHYLLTNVVYAGKVKYKTELHEGEHTAIVDPAVWQKVQSLLNSNGKTGGAAVRNKYGALLKGLLFCGHCNCAMSPTHSTKGNKRYRYYLCTHAQKNGHASCPSPSIPAGEIERFTLDQIKGVVRNPSVVQATIAQLLQQAADNQKAASDERRSLNRDLAHWHAELQELAAHPSPGRLADLHERIAATERRLAELHDPPALPASDITSALARFDDVWSVLTPREQTRFVELLVQRVDYDGSTGKIAIALRPDALPLLADQLRTREDAA
jgi:site-specific DNA recombinase